MIPTELMPDPSGDVTPPSGIPVIIDDPDPQVLGPARRPMSVGRLVVSWVAVTLATVVVVLYFLGPIFPQRQQHKLLVGYRHALKEASLEDTGLFGYTLPTAPPATGSSVGILEIGALGLQQVVTEGVGPAQTEGGPGHVPGTAGLGQPGNSVVVGRRALFGRTFSGLSSLRRGDPILVSTTEGQSVYDVTQVRTIDLTTKAAAATPSIGLGGAATPVAAPTTLASSEPVDTLYGPSNDNRLTLVTSGSVVPWNTKKATVVIATMKTVPFTATFQQSRSADQEGTSGGSDPAAPLVLVLLVFGAVAAGSVLLYRRCPPRSAYLISTPPLVAGAVLLALAVSHALPAWA